MSMKLTPLRARIDDVRHYFAETSKFLERSGLQAARNFEQGMSEFID
ncbi:MAG: hypothetical protein QFB89_05150 [Pseudomonadota bacterium]|nr:hypothetical protein [Pseudomonadota bacterium]